jgi:hypothetical protein
MAESPERALWAAVLLQVKTDIDEAPLDSLAFMEAVSFVRDGTHWAMARAAIASCLDLDAGAIRQIGMKWIAQRRQAEGLPAAEPPPPRPVDRPPPNGLQTVKPARCSTGKTKWSFNPDNPLLRRTFVLNRE